MFRQSPSLFLCYRLSLTPAMPPTTLHQQSFRRSLDCINLFSHLNCIRNVNRPDTDTDINYYQTMSNALLFC